MIHPGTELRFIEGQRARSAKVKRVLFRDADEGRDLLIVETARGNVVIRDRTPGADGKPWPTWHHARTPREAARKLDPTVLLHARALRELDWFGHVAEEV